MNADERRLELATKVTLTSLSTLLIAVANEKLYREEMDNKIRTKT